jgi:PKD repeat protein
MKTRGWGLALLCLWLSACTPCGYFEGELDGPCYANNTCNSGLVCFAGFCEAGGDVITNDIIVPIDTLVGSDEGSGDTPTPDDIEPPDDLNLPDDVTVSDDSDASLPGDVLTDHCAEDTHTCDLNATCTPSAVDPKGYICTCKVGFSGSGEECADVDECAAGNDSCGESQSCVNTEGSFVCSDLEVEISAVDYSEPNPTMTGMAPYAVHVDALNSLVGGGSELTARYLWSFGDATEETKYNVLEGWGGAHIYHAPGTYTVTLEITNELGATESTTTSVNILPDTRQNIYISATGNDVNDGLTEGTAIRSVTRIQELMGNNRAFLFSRGETHDFSALQLTIEGVENVILGAYGVGAKPIIMGPAYDPSAQLTLISVISLPSGQPTRNLTIRDLQFRTPSPASSSEEFNHIAIQLQGRDIINTTIRDNHFTDVGSCLLVDKGAWDEAVDANVRPTGLLLQDNTVDIVSRYFAFFRSHSTTMMGNSSIQGSLTSFIFRYYADKVFIYFNDWKQPASPLEEFAIAGGNHCGEFGGLPSDCEEEHENAFWGQYTYAARNSFDGTMRLGYENSETVFSYYRYIVLERNRFTRLAPNQSPTSTVRHWKYSDKIMIRNNLFLGPFGFVSMTGEGMTDVRVYNNTGLDPANAHMFVNVYGTNPALDSFHFANNLWLSPNYVPNQFGGYPYVLAFPSTDLTGYSFKNNLWPTKSDPGVPGGEIYGGQDYSAEAWKLLPQTSNEKFHTMAITDVDSQYRPLLGTDPHGAGIAVPGVFTDFYGNLRPESGAWTVGAVEAQ